MFKKIRFFYLLLFILSLVGGISLYLVNKRQTLPGQAQVTSIDISYNGSAFNPSNVTVNAGDTVRWTNNSSSALEIASDPHPTHTDNPALNLGNVSQGNTVSFTFNDPGTYGYHNHQSAGVQGTITVQSASISPTEIPTDTPLPSSTPNPTPTENIIPSLTPLPTAPESNPSPTVYQTPTVYLTPTTYVSSPQNSYTVRPSPTISQLIQSGAAETGLSIGRMGIGLFILGVILKFVL